MSIALIVANIGRGNSNDVMLQLEDIRARRRKRADNQLHVYLNNHIYFVSFDNLHVSEDRIMKKTAYSKSNLKNICKQNTQLYHILKSGISILMDEIAISSSYFGNFKHEI